MDFRGKIINLALDMFILTWISSAKRSRFQTITGKKDETKATDLDCRFRGPLSGDFS